LLGDDQELRRLFVTLREKIGVDFSGYKPSTLRRRLERRLVRNRIDRLPEYLKLLEQSPVEARALYEELLIHVTGFFRDPPVFEALRTTVLPRLLDKRPASVPIRVWVPGCSSGEEVYSLAICLLEALGDAGLENPVKLFGTDVSDAAIERARAGLYPESIASDMSPARLKRFFLSTGSGYQIRPDIRDMCVFARQDVASDPPFSNMDLISCRNLLIYLGQGLQGRVIAVLHYALRDGGYLVLGTSESISTFPGFSLTDSKNRIFARIPGTGRLLLDFPGRWPSVGKLKIDQLAPPTSPVDLNKEVDRVILARYGTPGVVVTEDLTIVQFRGQTGAFLDPLPGTASLDLFRMAREEIRMDLRSAIDAARQSGEPAQRTALWGTAGKLPQRLTIEVVPVRVPVVDHRYYLVLFQTAPVPAEEKAAAESSPDAARREVESELRRELAGTREYLRSVIEQLEASNEELRAANEEVVSSNEELLSTNEELQTAKEELQATNEELTTVNEEVLQRNIEATRVNTDLINVLSSVEIPIVLLGRGARVRRFTPAAGRLLHLIATDIGRPLTDLKPQIHIPDLDGLIQEVLTHDNPQHREVQDDAGSWYEVVVRPYVTLDDKRDGAVVSILDIDALKASQVAVGEARDFSQSIVDTVREWLLVLDDERRVVAANRTVLQALQATAEETLGRSVFALRGGSWDTPALRRLLDAASQERGVASEAPIELDLPGIGRRYLAVNAHRIEASAPSARRILLALDDVTDEVRVEQTHRSYEQKLKQMAFETAAAEERERRRIAADLHDRIGQALALIDIKLNGLRQSLGGAGGKDLDDCRSLVRQSIVDLRTQSFELSPPILYDLGLEAAVSWLADQMKQDSGLEVHIDDDGEPKPLEETTAALLFRAIREPLLNVLKHAHTGVAWVSLRREGEQLCVQVRDEGVGFDVEQAQPTSGFGLFSVRERISRLGGSVEISTAPGRGVHAELRLPLRSPTEKVSDR
jgi:two-component system CheB/CheR fusion protein